MFFDRNTSKPTSCFRDDQKLSSKREYLPSSEIANFNALINEKIIQKNANDGES